MLEANSRARSLVTNLAKVGNKAIVIFMLSGSILMFGDVDQLVIGGSPVSDAQAIIGRPPTPLSYAGVGRRTTRRAIRRSYYCHGVTVYHPCY